MIGVGSTFECFECAAHNPLPREFTAVECAACGETSTVNCRDCCRPHIGIDLNVTGRCDPCSDQHRKSARREAWLDEGNIR